MTYIYDFLCTYQNHDTDDQEDIYRAQFLQAFSLQEWNDAIINNTTQQLYNELKSNEIIKELLEKMKNNISNTSPLMQFFLQTNNDCLEETLFRLLFGFDLFNLAHSIICNLKNKHNNVDYDVIIEKIITKMKN